MAIPRALAITIFVVVGLFFAYIVLEVLAYVGILNNPALLSSGRKRPNKSDSAEWHWSFVVFIKSIGAIVILLIYTHLYDRFPILHKFIVFRRPSFATEENITKRFVDRTIARVVRIIPWLPDPYILRGAPYIMMATVWPTYMLKSMDGAIGTLSKELSGKVSPHVLVGIMLGAGYELMVLLLFVLAKLAPAFIARSDIALTKRIIICAAISGGATIAYMFTMSQANSNDVASLLDEALVNSVAFGAILSIVCLHLTRTHCH